MTAEDGDGDVATATVNWVTHTSFDRPLVVIGVKVDSGAYEMVKKTGFFALDMLGKGQQGAAFGFFKPAEKDRNTISGEAYHSGANDTPIIDSAPAASNAVSPRLSSAAITITSSAK